MTCNRVRRQLSLYLDEMLDSEARLEVARHLNACSLCGLEFDRLSLLQSRLRGLGPSPAPPFLRRLVDMGRGGNRSSARSLFASLRDALEYRWSRIRSTEGIWFGTRIAGTLSTGILFFALYTAMSPLYLPFDSAIPDRSGLSNLRQQLPQNVLRNLGLIPVELQRRPISPSNARLNDIYLLNFGQSASRRPGGDDSLTVVTKVDRSGAAQIQNVLEYPADSALLSSFNDMLASARYRPARQNGRAVDSHLVLSFSMISVHD